MKSRIHSWVVGFLAITTIATSVIIGIGAKPAVAELDGGAACGQLLGFYSDRNLRASSENRYADLNLGSAIPRSASAQLGAYIDWDYSASSPAPDPSSVTLSASGLPPGVRLTSEVRQDTEAGKPYKAKYFYITGTPTREGEFEVELEATAPGCPDDAGRVFMRVGRNGEGVSCSLTNAGSVARGQKATLNWTVRGPARRGSMDPDIPGGTTQFKSNGSAQTGNLNEDTDFTLTVEGPINDAECSTRVLVGGTSGNSTQYIKTVLDMPTISSVGGGQSIADATYVNGRFVFSGSYSVGMDGISSTGGTWTIKEDGSGTVQERSAALDAGAASTRIYQHGNAHASAIFNIGTDSYVRENASWASCPVPGADVFSGNCEQYGAGANRAVIYRVSPESGAEITTLSPVDSGLNAQIKVSDKYAIGNATRTGWSLVSLPGWNTVGTVPTSISVHFGYNDYFIGTNVNGSTVSAPHVYKVENNALRDLGELPGSPTFLGFAALDHSTTPARLVIYQSATRTNNERKLLTYEPLPNGAGLRLVSTRPAPTRTGVDPRSDNPSTRHGFGVWGEYVVWPESAGHIGDGTFAVWKNGEKVDTVRLPKGGGVNSIVVGKNGYMVITGGYVGGDDVRTAAYLYKIGGGGTPPGGGNCDENPLDPACNPGGNGTTTVDQIPGQRLSITYGTSTNPTPPELLLQFGQVVSAAGKNFVVSIFGRTFNVDATNGRILNHGWQNTTAEEFLRTGFANVYGLLDSETSNLVHAITVRNPIPVTALGAAALRTGMVAGASTNVQLQASLEALQQALQLLLQIVGR